ncbi:1472_t:CDS:2 [Funneliformis geosporum]|uniref:13171_t:CDS:1 n=1 Tax=Funneliformis geosporum TaxID=1117311 RepID=A0A9W4SWT7_9GLOM|nr:1472_t:CDS:2 [Funneliformis geosporum]CAI2184430.1 13171_t:CDS:2 [Funneliformis geosporum]
MGGSTSRGSRNRKNFKMSQGLLTNSSPLELKTSIEKRQFPDPSTQQGHVAYADFDPLIPYFDVVEPMTGRITFTIMNDGGIRVIGQCNTGFTEPDPRFYTVKIVPRPLCPPYVLIDLTRPLQYSINVPGNSAFQADYYNFNLDQIINFYVVVKMGGTLIGAAEIKRVGINPDM